MMTSWAALAGWALALGVVLVSRAELRRRAELVARACHELRGPLTAASLALHAAGRGGEAPAPRLAAVEIELGRAGLALGDLGAAGSGAAVCARFERGALIDACDLIATQLPGWKAVAAAAGRELRLGGGGGPKTWVRGDRLRLAQATSNLITNALEHGAGVVTVSVHASAEHVRIEVCDDGPGLPAPVARIAASARAGRGARGRGLAIAAAIAASHGGRIAAAPSGGGARIALELPAVRRRAA